MNSNPTIGSIMANKTPEERKEIAKKSGETRRKNNAEKHRMQKALDYALRKQVRVDGKLMSNADAMVVNMVNIAQDRDDKRCVAAFNAVNDLIKKIDDKETMANSINIEGNNVQVIFSDETQRFSR